MELVFSAIFGLIFFSMAINEVKKSSRDEPSLGALLTTLIGIIGLFFIFRSTGLDLFEVIK